MSQFPKAGLEAPALAETDETVVPMGLFHFRPISPTSIPYRQVQIIIMRLVLIKFNPHYTYQYRHFRLDTQAPNQRLLPIVPATTADIVLQASLSHWRSSSEHRVQDAILRTNKRYEDFYRDHIHLLKNDVARLSVNDSCAEKLMRFHRYPASRPSH